MTGPHTPNAAHAMDFHWRPILLLALLSISTSLYADPPGLAHHLMVELRPDDGTLSVDDTITVATPVSRFEFVLNAGLSPAVTTGTLRALRVSADGLRRAYRVTVDRPTRQLRLRYQGPPRCGHGRGMAEMPDGELSNAGIYLDARCAWYPLFDRAIERLDLAITVPSGWQSLSIGTREDKDGRQHWSSALPHDDIYLIAGRYTRHAKRHGDIETSVWLLDDDPKLAQRYLRLIGDYIDHYSRLLGDYPYPKFAVVENRWQTGYGMPSFTLLGSRVLRLPFIPYTSLPHEIVHNWWGNGVWVDYRRGNWSEGLTAYLADHWMQERRGHGAGYRLKALQRYSNFAAAGDDRPLLEFVSRHSDASQSIGYSKSLMLFHLLRRHMGDTAFIAGLRRLWQTHRFQAIGFARALQTLTAGDPALQALYQQWLERDGAPRLMLSSAQVEADSEGYRLTLDIHQQQSLPFVVDLPIAVTLEDAAVATWRNVRIDSQHNRVVLRFPRRPVRVDIDPAYDTLRILDPTEQPPALNRLFGGTTTVVMPSDADEAERAAWRALLDGWQRRYPGLHIISDADPASLDPADNLLILGWDNQRLADTAARLTRQDQTLEQDQVRIAEQTFDASDSNIVLLNTSATGTTTGFIGAADADAIAKLARKLPHYGGYGRLVFDNEGNNRLKQTLQPSHSHLSRQLGHTHVPLSLPPATALGVATIPPSRDPDG